MPPQKMEKLLEKTMKFIKNEDKRENSMQDRLLYEVPFFVIDCNA